MESQARQAIQTFLQTNESEFFSGIVQQQQQRGFQHVTVSRVTPPTGYYYACVFCSNRDEVTNIGISNDLYDEKSDRYYIELTIVDAITITLGEEELYESNDVDFQTVTDRIYEKIKSSTYFNTGTVSFRKTNDNVRKVNESPYYSDAEIDTPLLLSTITFSVDLC